MRPAKLDAQTGNNKKNNRNRNITDPISQLYGHKNLNGIVINATQ